MTFYHTKKILHLVWQWFNFDNEPNITQMSGIIEGYNYDIFISYRQKDNRGERWVSEFFESLKMELESTFKEEISVYFDNNTHDGLLETHDVDESLKEKLKCLVFIPIISRTYCDPRSFAWEHEFRAFVKQASEDQFGLKVKLPNGNVAGRVLPVKIHDLDADDEKLYEAVLGGVLRGIEFIYKEPGVNRPLNPNDDEKINLNKTRYRNQINKVALAIKDIIHSIKIPEVYENPTNRATQTDIEERLGIEKGPENKMHNLPISTTSFVGREKEIKEVKNLFSKSRIITLTGAGGCGKTRLAREIALTLVEEFRDGVWFTNLAPVNDPNMVIKEILKVLNIQETPGRTVTDILIDNIKDKSLLLLLDNCEHLINACAEITEKLIRTINGIRIMATSREALNIPGEVVWRIPSLSVPKHDTGTEIADIQDYEAVKLFADRAAYGNPDFILSKRNISPIIGICQRVAGIPLAIELAATRIRHLGPEAILERLDDQFKILSSSGRTIPERHQTLNATIDWSYDLLTDEEQILFNRLSVFAGDISLEASEEVCSDNVIKKEDVLFILSQLVDKSLILAEKQEDESVRYRFLAPLQQYSLQKLSERGEESKVRKSHMSYYLKLSEQAYDEQFESQLIWVNILQAEHNNLMAALSWSENYLPEEFIKLCGYLAWFWRGQTQTLLGTEYLGKAISKITEKNEAYARVIFGLAMILLYSDKDKSRIIGLMNESLEIWRKFKNLREEAWVLSEISEQYIIMEDYVSGQKYGEQSLKIAKELGNPGLINHCLMFVCEGIVYSKQYERGRQFAEELLLSSEKLGHILGIENARHFLGDCAQGMGNFIEAEKRYAHGIETGLKYGFLWLAACDMQGVAFALSGQKRWAKSIRLDIASREKVKTLGGAFDGMVPFWDEWIETYLGGARKEAGEELTRKYEEEGRNMGFEAAVEYALDFDRD